LIEVLKITPLSVIFKKLLNQNHNIFSAIKIIVKLFRHHQSENIFILQSEDENSKVAVLEKKNKSEKLSLASVNVKPVFGHSLYTSINSWDLEHCLLAAFIFGIAMSPHILLTLINQNTFKKDSDFKKIDCVTGLNCIRLVHNEIALRARRTMAVNLHEYDHSRRQSCTEIVCCYLRRATAGLSFS
jgi:hypothetical protein